MTCHLDAELRKPPKQGDLIPELDGVRGIAILLVLLLHFQEARPSSIPRVLGAPLSLGWSGVDLFFVLSGFLITGILVETRRSGNYFSSFYVRRMLRIFPLYMLSIFAYFVVALPLAHHFGHWQDWSNNLQMWYWLHLSNWRSAFGQDVPLLTHFWSLSIEEQFYFIWPMVVLLVKPSWLVYVCAAMILTPLGLRLTYVNNNFGWEFLHRLTPFRIDSLAVGCLIALVVRNKKWLGIIGNRLPLIACTAVSILLAVLFFSSRGRALVSAPLMLTWGYSAFAFAYGCLVFSAYFYTGSSMWLAVQLRSAFLRAFGKHSYAIYVLHYPVAAYRTRFLYRISDHVSERSRVVLWVLTMVLGILLTFVLSKAAWHLLEKHFFGSSSDLLPCPTGAAGCRKV